MQLWATAEVLFIIGLSFFFSESLWGWELKTDSSILTFEFEINDYLPEFYSRVFGIDGPK